MTLVAVEVCLLGAGVAAAAVACLLEWVLAPWWGRRQARREFAAGQLDRVVTLDQLPAVPPPGDRRADVGPPPGTGDRRRADVGPAGRHRREDAATGSFSATAVLRRLNAEADALPKPTRPTRQQLDQANR